MQDPLAEARRIFSTICPDADFLPAAPDPEDIVWGNEDDVNGAIDKLSSEGPTAAATLPHDISATSQQETTQAVVDDKPIPDAISKDAVTAGDAAVDVAAAGTVATLSDEHAATEAQDTELAQAPIDDESAGADVNVGASADNQSSESKVDLQDAKPHINIDEMTITTKAGTTYLPIDAYHLMDGIMQPITDSTA